MNNVIKNSSTLVVELMDENNNKTKIYENIIDLGISVTDYKYQEELLFEINRLLHIKYYPSMIDIVDLIN